MRNLGLIGALVLALLPRPAQAQGDFIKSKLKDLIEKSGVYVSASTRTLARQRRAHGPTLGVGYGAAGRQQTGRKYPVQLSAATAAIWRPTAASDFGRFKATQIMSGIGYSGRAAR